MIPVRNIYHMLAYAFQILRNREYANLASEPFEHVADLFAAILSKGMALQIRKGLHRSYVAKNEEMTTPVGHIDFAQTNTPRHYLRHRIVCCHDDYSSDVFFNRIIKTTLLALANLTESPTIKSETRLILRHMSNVGTICLQNVTWNRLVFDRNSLPYQMMIGICELSYRGLLQTKGEGKHRLVNFEDEQALWALYQRFVFNYYKREFPKLTVSAERINWQLDDGVGDSLLPTMNTDITLSHGNNVLIIDTKFYAHTTTQTRHGAKKHHIGNLYQMFAYVKNRSYVGSKLGQTVSGLLLYAGTKETPINSEYQMSGNSISIKSLNLGCEFQEIRHQLDGIANKYFGQVN